MLHLDGDGLRADLLLPHRGLGGPDHQGLSPPPHPSALISLTPTYRRVSPTPPLVAQEVTGEPVPVTLFCSNKTGVLVNVADFLAGEGLALKERKPRCVCVFTSLVSQYFASSLLLCNH